MKQAFTISKANWDQIINYAQCAYDEFKSEIGGMSIMVRNGNIWELQDPVILKQEISAGACELDKEALATYYSKVALENQDKDYRICWWHSHHTMDAFWSGTDKKAIEEYSNADLSFALVVNLREEYKFRVSVWRPIEAGEDVDLTIYDLEAREIPEETVKEVKELCEKPTTVISNGTQHWGNAYKKQLSLYSGTHEVVDFTNHTEAGDFLNDLSYAPVQAALDFSKSISDDYAEETINHKDYQSEVKKFNDMLKVRGIKIKVKKLSKTDAEVNTYSTDISDFLDVDDTIVLPDVEDFGGWT